MPKPLVFECPLQQPAKDGYTGDYNTRVSGKYYKQIVKLSKSCGLTQRAVTDKLVAYALANVKVKARKIYDMVLEDEDDEDTEIETEE